MAENPDSIIARLDERTKAMKETIDEVHKNQKTVAEKGESNTRRIDKLETNLWWVGILASVVASLTYAIIPPIVERMRFSISDSRADSKKIQVDRSAH